LNVLPAGGRGIGGFPFSLFLFLQGAQVHGSSPFGLLNGLPENLYSALLSFSHRQRLLAENFIYIHSAQGLPAIRANRIAVGPGHSLPESSPHAIANPRQSIKMF
jgi:hypothetical protein